MQFLTYLFSIEENSSPIHSLPLSLTMQEILGLPDPYQFLVRTLPTSWLCHFLHFFLQWIRPRNPDWQLCEIMHYLEGLDRYQCFLPTDWSKRCMLARSAHVLIGVCQKLNKFFSSPSLLLSNFKLLFFKKGTYISAYPIHTMETQFLKNGSNSCKTENQ